MSRRLAVLLIGAASILPTAHAAAQETGDVPGATHAMMRSIDPQVFANLMNQMMAWPMGVIMNPMSTCAACHTEDDVARYTLSAGPAATPGGWMNPMVYPQMMAAPMDPETYEKWYRAWMEKFGAMLPQPAPPAE